MSTLVLGANSLNCDYFEIIKAGGMQKQKQKQRSFVEGGLCQWAGNTYGSGPRFHFFCFQVLRTL